MPCVGRAGLEPEPTAERNTPTPRNHRTVGCPGVAPGARIVGLRYQNAKSVLTIAGDALPVHTARSRARMAAR